MPSVKHFITFVCIQYSVHTESYASPRCSLRTIYSARQHIA